MNVAFFSRNNVQTKIKDFERVFEGIEIENAFEEERNKYVKLLLSSFLLEPEEWDDRAKFNIKEIGEGFANTIITSNSEKEDLDNFYADCFRFFIERYISGGEHLIPIFNKCKHFTIENKEKFSHNASMQISYAIIFMPLDIFRRGINNEDVSLIKEFIKTHQDCQTLKTGWDGDFAERMSQINKLKEALNEQKNAYNFVGLYNGFDNLSNSKKTEKTHVLRLLWGLGILTIVPIVGEFIFMNLQDASAPISHGLLTMIPAFSLIFIFLYYFRIALHNYKSINTQISQIELRKSLCMFIQNYADYAHEIKKSDSSLLDRFEMIIFSNIAMSDEKLPSTFDGLEPFANLIKSVKN